MHSKDLLPELSGRISYSCNLCALPLTQGGRGSFPAGSLMLCLCGIIRLVLRAKSP